MSTISAVKKSCTSWAKESWKGKVGLRHRHVKEQQSPKFEMLTSNTHGEYGATADPDITEEDVRNGGDVAGFGARRADVVRLRQRRRGGG